MLIVCYRTSMHPEDRYMEFHKGDSNDLKVMSVHPGLRYITADCDELELVNNQFVGLPSCNKRVVAYYGDTARFILGNINLKE